jgi:hypothetical protein
MGGVGESVYNMNKRLSVFVADILSMALHIRFSLRVLGPCELMPVRLAPILILDKKARDVIL